jgi:hypothetical protein
MGNVIDRTERELEAAFTTAFSVGRRETLIYEALTNFGRLTSHPQASKWLCRAQDLGVFIPPTFRM